MAIEVAAETVGQERKDPKTMNLAQKFVELRRACPGIVKRQHSEGVKYKFAKIFDVYELLAPAMNAWGVDWDIVKEVATRHHENGDAKFYDSFIQQTRNGDRVVWVYEADLTLRWINVDNTDDVREVTLHALGTNDGGPDKAKGAAWTYCIKYYLFELFNIDQGEDDPDASCHGAEPVQGVRRTCGGISEAQVEALYQKAEVCGMSREATDKRVREKYNRPEPSALTRTQYEEICGLLENAVRKREERRESDCEDRAEAV